jgi:hypothetical protein
MSLGGGHGKKQATERKRSPPIVLDGLSGAVAADEKLTRSPLQI